MFQSFDIYADDTVLLAPSPKAIQSLINICVSFPNNHGLVYDEQKTKVMCLKPAVLKNMYVPKVTRSCMSHIQTAQDILIY